MKAAICYEFGQPLVVEEVTLESPQYGEVKVRLVATAICHSDIHLIRGEWGGEEPVIAGHESAGVVEEIGVGVTLVKVGDRVVVSLLRSCGRCDYCLTGSPQHCDGTFALDTASRIRNLRGEVIRQGINVGGFAEYAVVDQSQLVRIPDDMQLETAALLACGVITGFGAAVNTGHVTQGSTVVVIGTGGVGLNAVQGAAVAGARRIIAVDLLDNKLEAATRFGATNTINASKQDAVKEVYNLTNQRGADFALVTVGSNIAINQSFEMVRNGGTIVIAGLPPLDAAVTLPTFSFVVTGKRLLGSSMGSTRLQVDVPILIDHYQHGKLRLDELISGRYRLEQINEAIESTERGEALRNVIVFNS
jgi:S-(hydroxymethyl)glutathione dehydrogenase/alcohol dehydrogenase